MEAVASQIVTDLNFLRKESSFTTVGEVEKLNLIKLLQDANKTAWTKGAGLAAVQIGIPIRFAWYRFGDVQGTLLNPEIINSWGEEIADEGCLSIPNKYVKVGRAYEIEYRTNGQKKRANGFLARVIQHEIDHMNGILTIDKNGQTIKDIT